MTILEETQRTEAEKIKGSMVTALKAFAQSYKLGYDRVWNRRDGISPQEILDQFGTDAVALFIKSAAARDFIMAHKPDLLPEAYRQPAQPVTFNQDGTVTVG